MAGNRQKKRPENRGEQLRRQYGILHLLESRRFPVLQQEIVELLECSERTVQRDMKDLQDAGFPVKADKNDEGRRTWSMPRAELAKSDILLSRTEAISLYLAREMLAALTGTSLAEGLNSVMKTIRSRVPASALEHFKDLSELVVFRSKGRTDYARHRKVVEALAEGVRACRVVEVGYRALWRDEEYTARIHPYALVLYESDLYVLGYSERSQEIRTFKVIRTRSARLTGSTFRRPADFRVEDYFNGCFGITQTRGEPIDVELRFEYDVADVVAERQWHPSQKLRRNQDGSIDLAFRLSDTPEFRAWIKGWMPHVQIVRPDHLATDLAEELSSAALELERQFKH